MKNTERIKTLFFKKNLLIISSAVMIFSLYLAGCVNVEQKTKLKLDGSGSMKVHYWTKMNNLNTSTEIGGFSFDESKARQNYTSSNTEVTALKIEDKLDDSTKHVNIELNFKNINDINSAKAFEKVKASWKEGKDGMDFSYIVAKDTASAKNMGASETTLYYEFEFPAEVLSTNGRKDGMKVIYEKTLADLKDDLEMTATIKTEGKKCGLFGMEFPILVFTGLTLLSLSISRRKK